MTGGPRRIVPNLAADLAAGLGLLTRLPVGWLVPRPMPYRPGRGCWTYPLVGLLVGGAAALVRLGAGRLGLPPLLGAAWAVGAGVLLTGALHEDGLADTADGLGGGTTRERRLEIMRDSRIGSYGALALVLALGVRVLAIASLPADRATAALLASGALSRAAMLPVLGLLPPARADGLGRSVGRPPGAALWSGLAVASGLAVLLLPTAGALAAIPCSMVVSLATTALARRRLGGQTGDVLGACCVATECVLLTLFTIG